ncbi:hypothetical protein SELMODRAFT_431543 [Selaginella moellendorffii]|uniref:Replication factor A C-terminal domain-containing protein n=1 Tax=Selaginella moellendorffii TaxID=88036 RepID=D8TD04_SELML|nr:hypothetical protein SELMODRAFT_431543 [Selaginella moellendorffii]
MCLWDSEAEDEGSEIKEKPGQGERPIVCVKGSQISDYNGNDFWYNEMLSINLKVSEFSAIFHVIVSVKEFQTGDFYYPACMKVVNGRQCGKKVTQVSESMWQCNSCDTDFGDIHFKYALHLCILDSTGHIWAVAFDDANEIVEMPACF